ncbi:dynein beta chain, ciliary-like [Daphnia pulex]|uniref:dynein beta chain, ciliary-like n=1 Tax=Daphnia pulex TaxID=6669 RepID=UPI001EDED5BD|nr:dynein beta chain, ciliary-like [Daphnia pulex]XP_046453521.1 dynein beta chain, ciliary-like [Daphnia pulex]
MQLSKLSYYLIRGLDKEMRAWDAYIGLDDSVRDLLTSLKAISELQNPAVRERPWTQLIEATKRKTFLRDNFTVSLVTGIDTTLADLLALDLHRYEDEVRSVVYRAVREVSMEKTLRELEATWATLEWGKEEHARTGLTWLKASDELIATLEDNQVQLQTLASSKYVAHLMTDVLDWQRRLGLSDQVLALWCEVQRSWSHLESIFAGSCTDDIRQQLPEDSYRFDETNANLKELLGHLLLKPNVISVSTRPNVLDDKHRIDSQLQLCEIQIVQLNSLVGLLGGDLSPNDMQKVTTLCTIDVHSRDVVARLVQPKVESSQAFAWQSQLRHRWNYTEKDCFVNICDAQFRYWYEYLGNTPRLVVTPLTDRGYVTLAQSLHLTMGGAPAGPAGTGKTETTKDLGRALGMLVYVFNCSEQMDYKTCGNIYKGLAKTGAWGCFDEFNRISVEVLSRRCPNSFHLGRSTSASKALLYNGRRDSTSAYSRYVRHYESWLRWKNRAPREFEITLLTMRHDRS